MLQALSAITVTPVLPSSLPPAQQQIAALLKHLEGGGGNSQPRAESPDALWLSTDLSNEMSQNKLTKHL